MDADLIARWRARRQPFAGSVLVLPWPGVSLADLRQMLSRIVAVLETSDGRAPLETLEDWHEHDGYPFASKACRWQDLHVALSSNADFLQLRPGDTFVRRGYLPQKRTWYLRIWFDDDDELDSENRPTRGTLDLSGDDELVELLHAKIPALERHNAGEFFDRNHAGA